MKGDEHHVVAFECFYSQNERRGPARSEETPDVPWDERRLWLELKDEYMIEISLDDRSGKTHGFWYWLKDSDAGFWNDVEIKGFLHCGIDHAVAACFRKGSGKKSVFVTTLDLPSENENWFEGTYEDDSMTSDWFSMSIEVLNQGLWDKIIPSAFQIAAVNFELVISHTVPLI